MTETPSTDGDASSDTTRRSVLKAAGATAAVGLGGAAASGTAGARSVRPVAADRAAVETVFDWHADDLLAALADDGLVESADASVLDTRPATMDAVLGSHDGTAVVRDVDSGVHEVRTVREVDGGTLSVSVETETGKAYAFYRPDSGGRYLYDPDAGYFGDEIGTLCHTCECRCSNILCDNSRSERCECCCDGDCHVDHYCNC